MSEGLKVYIRGRREPFKFPKATDFEKCEDRIVLYDKRPSESNPYNSRSPKSKLYPLGSFYAPTVDAVIPMDDEDNGGFLPSDRAGRIAWAMNADARAALSEGTE